MAGIVAAAFSKVLGSTVLTYEQYEREKETDGAANYKTMGIDELFRISHSMGEMGQSLRDETFHVFVKGPNERTYESIQTRREEFVSDIKATIEMKIGLPSNEQRLIYGGRQLEDSKQVRDYHIEANAVLHLVMRLSGGGGPGGAGSCGQSSDDKSDNKSMKFVLEDNYDSKFDFDFTSMTDDGTEFYRGEKRYYRPYGWKRLAIKVLGKYADDDWLGEGGIRTYSSPGEWPVSYHGTEDKKCKSIAQEGFDLSKGERFAHGIGIYTAPSIEVAADYASEFDWEGKTYELVLQNRVSTEGLKEVSTTHGEYWVQPDDTLVRPYGICLRPVPASHESDNGSSCAIL